MNIVSFINKKSIEYGIQKLKIISLKKVIDIKNNLNFKSDLLNLEKYYPVYKYIIIGSLSYNYEWNNVPNNVEGYIARYTTGNFYKVLRKKLKKLANCIHEKYFYKLSKKNIFKYFINSNLVDEKFLAFSAGLGKYSRNSLVMIDDLGLQFVIGAVLLTEEINYKDVDNNKNIELISKNCETCKACIKSCPTNAINNYKINKNLCIQHLGSQMNWPEKINDINFIKLWGMRFFGCTDCIDICPQNKYVNKSNDEILGFVGKTADLKLLLFKKKSILKNMFTGNQIGANWIPVIVLIRNIIASLYNIGEFEMLKKFHNNIDKYEWNEEEIKFLKNFIFFYLNCNGF